MLRVLQMSLPHSDPARSCRLISIPSRLFYAAATIASKSPKTFEAVLRMGPTSRFYACSPALSSEPRFPVFLALTTVARIFVIAFGAATSWGLLGAFIHTCAGSLDQPNDRSSTAIHSTWWWTCLFVLASVSSVVDLLGNQELTVPVLLLSSVPWLLLACSTIGTTSTWRYASSC